MYLFFLGGREVQIDHFILFVLSVSESFQGNLRIRKNVKINLNVSVLPSSNHQMLLIGQGTS